MKELNRRQFLGLATAGLALAGCGKSNKELEQIVEENTTKKVGLLAERAKAVNYIPPPFKYNLKLDRDIMPLLMDPEKTALLVIDVQNLFTEPGAPIAAPDGPEVVVQINKLVDYCRAHYLPIIWIQATNRKDGSDAGMYRKYHPKTWSMQVRGNHWWELYPELHNEPADIYVTKPKYNAFWGSDLEAVLRGLEVESLIFTGIMTDVCVQTTLVDAFHRDFNPIIAADATGTATPYKKEALWLIETCFGRVLTTDETIAELEALTKTKKYCPDPAYKE